MRMARHCTLNEWQFFTEHCDAESVSDRLLLVASAKGMTLFVASYVYKDGMYGVCMLDTNNRRQCLEEVRKAMHSEDFSHWCVG